jgi:hypothetical protein
MSEQIGYVQRKASGYRGTCAVCTATFTKLLLRDAERALRSHADTAHPERVPVYRHESPDSGSER